MSKTIDFVGENIKDIKISIEGYKRLKTYYLSQENYEDCVIMSLEQNIKYLENKLSIWEQIKTELEAWEESKKYFILNEGYVDFYGSTYEYITLKNDCIDESNSEEEGISIIKIKKALLKKDKKAKEYTEKTMKEIEKSIKSWEVKNDNSNSKTR